MADDKSTDLPDEASEAGPPKRDWGKYWRRRFAAGVVGLIALLSVGVLMIDSPIGHRFITQIVASYAPSSGLRIKIGRIEGSILGRSTLHDVAFYDPKGKFLSFPEAELDWRPLQWFAGGLDVRSLVARRGHLLRLPELNPGDPDAPLLPDFSIRVDRFELDRLYVDEAVAGVGRVVNLKANANIADGRVKLNLASQLGGEDRAFLHFDASRKQDLFELKFHYNAPAGGLLAGLVGAQDDLSATIRGDGSWSDWKGGLLVLKGGEKLSAARLTKRGEVYGVLGQFYPQDVLSGVAARAVGKALSVKVESTFDENVLDGTAMLIGDGALVRVKGAVDVDRKRFGRMAIYVRTKDPDLLGVRADGLTARFGLDGPLRDLALAYRVNADSVRSGKTRLSDLAANGVANWDGETLNVPLGVSARRIVTGVAMLDPRLSDASLTGTVTWRGQALTSEALSLKTAGLDARLALNGNLSTGRYALTGPVALNGLPIEGIGRADARADADVLIGGPAGWSVAARVNGKVARVTNGTLADIAGSSIGVSANVTASGNAPVIIRGGRITSQNLTMRLTGSRALDGTVKLAGEGELASYGSFTADGVIDAKGPHAVLVFASPLPAAGLTDLRLALDPADEGYAITANGGSMLGPLDGRALLTMPRDAPAQLEVERLAVSDTTASGTLVLGDDGVSGVLALEGGGAGGSIALLPTAQGQGFAADVTLREAEFAGATPINVRSARLTVDGTLGEQGAIAAKVNAQGISRGKLFIGRLAAEGEMRDGIGSFRANLAGRRGSRLNLRLIGDVSPDRISLGARGRYANQRIRMPRRAVLVKQDGGWMLERTQLDFGDGSVLVDGRIGRETELTVKVSRMPLNLADILVENLGLGGTVSGVIEYSDASDRLATGRARLLFDDLTRSGLVLTSRPVDIGMVADLGASELQVRAVFSDGGQQNGRLQGRITGLPARGTLLDRLYAGQVYGQLRYDGPADALWRLVAVETFDLTGPVAVAGDVTGTIENPVVRGTLQAKDLRLQSALTGTDISGIAVRGSFDGAVLRLSRFSGKASNGGSVSGSGSVDLSDIVANGVGIDIRAAARNARLLDRDDMAATVTGPLRIVAKDKVGTIAGRLDLVSGRWRLGNADVEAALPEIARREINTPPDRQERAVKSSRWHYLIDVQAKNRFAVTGMGLDSEWRADVQLRGTTDAPRILGEANLVRGDYEFAGKRFELIRGRIRFSGESPPSPRLDIVAEADINDINARIGITGTALAPQIAFSSVPALPEEEVLSRLLFGDSISNISAPEALQLGAALASLHGGGAGGLDPINKLRSAIGLDRLRVIGADEALGRGTSVAVGEYLGRNLYAELVTDGQGYSATELEYRITGWLSLLATISSIGQNTIEVEASKDY